MRIRNTDGNEDRIELQMTPMIDIVFQLLIFFIMTFKIVAREGDFNVKMPAASTDTQVMEEPPPIELNIQVYLSAGADGELAGIKVTKLDNVVDIAEGTIGDTFKRLNAEIKNTFIGGAEAPDQVQDGEVEIGFDYNLKYIHVINALSEITGYIDPNTGLAVKLVEKIKFAQPSDQ